MLKFSVFCVPVISQNLVIRTTEKLETGIVEFQVCSTLLYSKCAFVSITASCACGQGRPCCGMAERICFASCPNAILNKPD